jgi:CRISPR-associated protein Csx3
VGIYSVFDGVPVGIRTRSLPGGVEPEEVLIERFGGVGMAERFEIKVREHEDFVFVDVALGGNGLITPEELEELVTKVSDTVGNRYFGKGVIISGRLPIWAHSALAHAFHGSKWVAHFDPRLGAVVSATHDPGVSVGTVIPHEKLNL